MSPYNLSNSDVPVVEIAMPAFNCSPWLDDFMQSLLGQESTNWRLIARDDHSDDNTQALLRAWQERVGPRMFILPDSGRKNLGLIGNYNAVLGATSARWVMCADPDDVWLPGKIARTLRAMRQTENTFGATTPIAVCTDAKVVDCDRHPVAPSYWHWSRVDPALTQQVVRVAMESVALGSTMLVNRALLDLTLPIADGARYQDWWMVMVAAAFGHVTTLDTPTIQYRRHGSNETADPYGASLLQAIRHTLSSLGAPRRRLNEVLTPAAIQAGAFLKRYRNRLNSQDRSALRSLASLGSLGPLNRRLAVLRYGLWFASPWKNLGMFALL